MSWKLSVLAKPWGQLIELSAHPSPMVLTNIVERCIDEAGRVGLDDPSKYRLFQAPPDLVPAQASYEEIAAAVDALGDLHDSKKVREWGPFQLLGDAFSDDGPKDRIIVILEQGTPSVLSGIDSILNEVPPTPPSDTPPRYPFRCHRAVWEHKTSPSSLLNPILGAFAKDLRSCSPSQQDIQCFRALQGVIPVIIENEDVTMKAVLRVLAAHGFPVASAELRKDNTPSLRTDGSIAVDNETKPDLRFYALHIAGNPVECIQDYLEGLRAARAKIDDTATTNFPCILLSHFGGSFSASVATFDGDTNAESLGAVNLRCYYSNNECAAGHRMICALRAAVARLREYYASDEMFRADSTLRPLNAPWPTEYTTASGERETFTYTHMPDPTKIVFGARARDGTRLVIKFSTTYGVDAHRAAAARGHAPRLHAAEHVGDRWIMVVTDDLSGAWDAFDAARMQDRWEAANGVLDALHADGFVHGDVRAEGLLVERAGPGAMIADFEWAGRAGEVNYPATMKMDPALMRPEGVNYLAPILAGHDKEMMYRTFGRTPE